QDTLVIDASNGNPVPTGGLRYDGGGGAGGTLVAPNSANAWNVTGTNAGTLNGLVSFTRTPNLTGGTSDDAFTFATGGSVSGVINGGTGKLSLDARPGPLNVTNTVLNQGDVTLTGTSITLGSTATISSRRLNGTDPLNSPSAGNSGSITLTSPTITL